MKIDKGEVKITVFKALTGYRRLMVQAVKEQGMKFGVDCEELESEINSVRNVIALMMAGKVRLEVDDGDIESFDNIEIVRKPTESETEEVKKRLSPKEKELLKRVFAEKDEENEPEPN